MIRFPNPSLCQTKSPSIHHPHSRAPLVSLVVSLRPACLPAASLPCSVTPTPKHHSHSFPTAPRPLPPPAQQQSTASPHRSQRASPRQSRTRSPAYRSSGGLTAQPTLASHRIADWALPPARRGRDSTDLHARHHLLSSRLSRLHILSLYCTASAFALHTPLAARARHVCDRFLIGSRAQAHSHLPILARLLIATYARD